jgi:hypothetical protein
MPLISLVMILQVYGMSLYQAELSLAFDVHQEATDNVNSFF